MKTKTIIALLILLATGEQVAKGATSKLVSIDPDSGKLVYTPDEQGNTIPDFSFCGYMKGGVSIPVVPAREVLLPVKGKLDDCDRIQAAIDKVSALELDASGFRGAVLLKKGVYRLSKGLEIKKSGVVLRGEGQGDDGTILFAKGKDKYKIIVVHGKTQPRNKNKTINITDDYVPCGAKSFSLESTNGLKVGDTIIIRRRLNNDWLKAIGMDAMPPRDGKIFRWSAKSMSKVTWERIILAINGNKITIEGPIVEPLDKKYGNGYIVRGNESRRINQVGVEHLRLISDYDRTSKRTKKYDDLHPACGVAITTVINGWVRNITTVHTMNSIHVHGAKYVTVQDCISLSPVSSIAGGYRNAFHMGSSFILTQRCYADLSRHSFVTGARDSGPTVFLDCLAMNSYSDSGPHHRWATGFLWDNLKGGQMNARDRGNKGTGQGWAGSQQIFWNCEASSMVVQNTQISKNYAIGCKVKGRLHGLDREIGHVEYKGTHVRPRSLYLQQLEDRLGKKAILNVTTKAQRGESNREVFKELKKLSKSIYEDESIHK